MRNGQLKPAYNVQLATTGQFIVGAIGTPHPSDMRTLIPFLDRLQDLYPESLNRIVCDAGYESIENYSYLDERNLESFIKPSNYDQAKKRKYKKEIWRRENMIYHEDADCYECANGRMLYRQPDMHKKRPSGYVETLRRYRCRECGVCPLQKQCIRYSKRENPQTREIRFNSEFNEFRTQSLQNVTSEEGVEERLNRSIQAEGSFAKIKDGLQYQRFRHRGMKSVVTDILLVAFGLNINTLVAKLTEGHRGIRRYRVAA